MKIEYFKEILALADIGNFLAASDYLYMSQSTLSRHVKSVEDEYDAMLFDRTTHKMEIRPEGELLLPYAKQISVLYSSFLEDAQTGTTAAKGLSIGIGTYSMEAYRIGEMLERFRQEHPEVTIVRIDDVDRNTWNITQFDFTFLCETDMEMQENSYGRLKIAEDEVAAVMSPLHPLADRGSITLEELRNDNFIVTQSGSWLNDRLMAACGEAGFTPRVIYPGLTGHNMVDMVRRGYGITFLKKKTAQHIYGDSVAIVTLKPSIRFDVNIVYLKRSLGPMGVIFLKYAEGFMHDAR